MKIIDEDDLTELNKSNFEDYIMVGTPMPDLLKIFRISHAEMDRWCQQNYNSLNFAEAYDHVIRVARAQFKKTLTILASRGNASAIALATKFVLDMDENDKAQNIRVTIKGDVPKGDKK